MVVRWRTNISGSGKVSYGTSSGSLHSSLNSTVTEYTTNTGTKVYEHFARLKNLSANTTYYYSVGTSSTVLNGKDGLTVRSFVTLPPVGENKSARIWVLGDPGTGTTGQANVRKSFEALSVKESKPADIWLMLGDNTYSSGLDSEYQTKLFDVYPKQLAKASLYVTRGNHDNGTGNNYLDNFTMPVTSLTDSLDWTDGVVSGNPLYYSFNYGEIHFVCLDSESSSMSSKEGGASSDSSMVSWLKNDLSSTRSQWIIAFWHHPPYSKGSHDSDTETKMINARKYLLPILENYGVDLVLTGHSHGYERSYLLDGHYGLSTTLQSSHILNATSGREDDKGAYQKSDGLSSHGGTVYAVAGSSGQVSSGSYNHPAMYLSLAELGSLVLDVSHNRLDVRFLRESTSTTTPGPINDYFTILKNSATSNTGGTTAAPTFTTFWNDDYSSLWKAGTTEMYWAFKDQDLTFKTDVLRSGVGKSLRYYYPENPTRDRVELHTSKNYLGVKEGDTVYFGWSDYYKILPIHDYTVFQWREQDEGYTGCPSIQFAMSSSYWDLNNVNGITVQIKEGVAGRGVILPNLKTGVWYDFVVAMKYAKDGTGFFKVWAAEAGSLKYEQVAYSYTGATMYSASDLTKNTKPCDYSATWGDRFNSPQLRMGGAYMWSTKKVFESYKGPLRIDVNPKETGMDAFKKVVPR